LIMTIRTNNNVDWTDTVPVREPDDDEWRQDGPQKNSSSKTLHPDRFEYALGTKTKNRKSQDP